IYYFVWRVAPGAGLASLPGAFQPVVLPLAGFVLLFITMLGELLLRGVLSVGWEILSESLRQLCRERVVLDHDGVTRGLSFGPWRWEHRARRQDVVDVEEEAHGGIVVSLASGEELRLDGFDSTKQPTEERLALLREVLGVPSEMERLSGRVPPGWESRTQPDGVLALEPTRWLRARAAWWDGVMTPIYALGAVLVACRVVLDGRDWQRLLFALVLGGLAVWTTLWGRCYLRGWRRMEVQPGVLVCVDRGLFRTSSTRYEAPLALAVVRTGKSKWRVTHDLWGEHSGGRVRLCTRTRFESESPRRLEHLGCWLGRHLGVTLSLERAGPRREEESSQKQRAAPKRRVG
ncbi:hypothetical protein HPC49_54465, partial [Pyxidicoccus fallax]